MRGLWIATLVTMTACNSLDTRDVERKAKQVGEDRVAPVMSVSCPSAKMKKGVRFTCKVRFIDDDEPRDLEFTLLDDEGAFDAQFVPRIVGGDRLASVIAEGLAKDQPELGEAAVDCGDGILEVPDDGVECHVVAGKLEKDLRVRVRDDASVDWTVVN